MADLLQTVHTWAGIGESCAVIGAAVCGGWWAATRWWRERTDQAALGIEVSTQATPLPDREEHLVVVTVGLTNLGKTKIQAKAPTKDEFAYEDDGEKLKFSGSLKIKRLVPPDGGHAHNIDWFDSPWLKSVAGLPEELDLMTEYRKSPKKPQSEPNNQPRNDPPNESKNEPEKDELVDFWMEPEETYQLRVPVVLPEGSYLAKVVFVAAPQPLDWVDVMLDKQQDPDGDFWSQIYGFTVPAPAAEAKDTLDRDGDAVALRAKAAP
jgi:hypothetical protein